MEVELLTQLEREEVLATRVVLRRSMDLRYEGQNYEIEVPVEPGEDGEAIRRRFTEIHRRLYEYATDEGVEGVNLRVAALVPTPAAPVSAASSATAGEGAASEGAAGTRRAHYYGLGWIPTPVHPRGGLSPGREIDGPAIVEDAWSTILVYPGQRCRCDALGHLWIEATP
jgi:N-methylhydantoinase A